jgi:hypothetical protein
MNKLSFVRGTRIDATEDDDRSDNAIKLPEEDDSQRSYSEESSGSYEDINVIDDDGMMEPEVFKQQRTLS